MRHNFICTESPFRSRRWLAIVALGLVVLLTMALTAVGYAGTNSGIDISSNLAEEDPETVVLKAVVLEAPDDPNGQGEWRVRVGQGKEWRVLVDANTQIRPPLPQSGQWLRVEGVVTAEDSILATKLRSDEFRANQVIVRLDGNISIDELADNYELEVQDRVLESANIYLLAGSDNSPSEQAIINQLKRDEHVLWAELNYVGSVPVADPYQIWKWGGYDPAAYVNQGAFSQIALPAVQPYYRGDGVIVAVLDTGISTNHPQLSERLLPGRDLVDDDEDPNEVSNGAAWGHGTHVAGVVAYIAPNSMILPVRVLDADGRGEIFVLAYAIEWAVRQGAKVVNLSLGTAYDSEVLRDVVDNATAQGVVIVAAAGNENGGTAQYPAAYPNVLGVTAVDAENHKADFANYSDWVDLAAPGVGIMSTIVGPDGNGYASWSGTSMATSFVSGVAALSKDMLPEATTTEIYDLLVGGAVDINSLNPDYVGQVGGLLSAYGALGEPQSLYLPMLIR